MALRAGRAGGKGVLSAPVRRTAVAAGAAAVVVDSINRWHLRRRARFDARGARGPTSPSPTDTEGRPAR